MKRIFILSLLPFFVFGAFGQKQEVGFGIGALSQPAINALLPFEKVLNDGGDTRSFAPALHVSYSRTVLPQLRMGLALVYERQKHDFASMMPADAGKHHVYHEVYVTGLLYGHYHWLQKGILDLYSGLGLGWHFLKQEDERDDFSADPDPGGVRSGFAYQFTPFGIRLGKRLAGYVELGYGYKGLVACGITYRF
jgi:hypothetical protein